MKTGLYIGRFQPLHNGHLAVIKQALTSVDHLYIGIGSSNVSNDENPFTFEQRKEMIMTTLAFASQQRWSDISGTEIRGRMITGAEWRSMVPNAVANIVLKLI